MNKSISFKNQKIFFLFFPLIYISGPLFTELLLIFLVFNSFYDFNLIKEKLINDNRLVQVFFVILFIQGFFNYPEINYKNILYVRFYFYYLAIKILINEKNNTQNNLNLFIKTIIYTFTFLIFFHLLQITTGVDLIDNRLTIPIRQEEIAISIYSKFYPFILLFLLLKDESLLKKDLVDHKYIVPFVVFMVPVIAILSGERMNTLFLISLIFFSLLRYRTVLFFFCILIFVSIFLLLENFEFFQNFERINYIQNRYSIFFNTISKDFIEQSYWGHHFITSINIFKENFLFGAGIKTFSTECLNYLDQIKYACTSHPHNIYLEVASETGIFVISIFIIIIIYVAKIFFINVLKRKLNTIDIIILSLGACILIYAFPIRSTGSFFNNYNSCYFWIFLGMLFEFNEKKKTK